MRVLVAHEVENPEASNPIAARITWAHWAQGTVHALRALD